MPIIPLEERERWIDRDTPEGDYQGVPGFGLPNIRSLVGRIGRPAVFASAL